ncbi:MAG: hypothetical protein ABW185_14385 [Sedimenticola sp.]
MFEETGICIKKTNYLASQPWPFPSSLMKPPPQRSHSTRKSLKTPTGSVVKR